MRGSGVPSTPDSGPQLGWWAGAGASYDREKMSGGRRRGRGVAARRAPTSSGFVRHLPTPNIPRRCGTSRILLLIPPLFGSEIGTLHRIVDSHLGNESGLIQVYHSHLHQTRILSRPVQNPTPSRCRGFDFTARTCSRLVAESSPRIPQTALSWSRQLSRSDSKRRLVIGIADHQTIFEHNRTGICRGRGLGTAPEEQDGQYRE
jgi:hypothetical protein